MRKDRLTAVSAVVAAVIVFAIAGVVLANRSSVPDAGSTPSVGAATAGGAADVPGGGVGASGSADAGGTGTAAGGTSGETGSRTGAHLLVAFLGDDYTLARGASTTSKGFVARLGAQLGVTTRAFGVDGGGYAKQGAGGKTYADLVDQVVAAHPDVVVVSGGRNDRFDNLDTLSDAARELFASLASALPHARLLAVSPLWGDSPAPSAIDDIGAKVRAAVQAAGGTYVALGGPLTGHPGWMADAADPNDAGYAAIAEALGPKLQPLLPDG